MSGSDVVGPATTGDCHVTVTTGSPYHVWSSAVLVTVTKAGADVSLQNM